MPAINNNLELIIQVRVCDYIRVMHCGVLFSSNYGSGIKLTIRQASIQKRLQSNRGAPDLIIYEPRGEYVGLAIELKREGVKIAKKDGSAVSTHVQEQNDYLEALRKRGWKCFFCIGYTDAIKTIDEYLGIDTLKVEF